MLDHILLICFLLCVFAELFWYHQIKQAVRKRIGKDLGAAEPYIERRTRAIDITNWIIGMIGAIKLVISIPQFIEAWFS